MDYSAQMKTNPRDPQMLRLKYEPDFDLLSVWVGQPQIVDNIEVEPGICVRVSRDHQRVVGVEIVDAAARLEKDATAFKSQSYAQRLLNKYGQMALDSPAWICYKHQRRRT